MIKFIPVLISILIYSIIISLALIVFIIYAPFTLVDNKYSYLICSKNKARFEIGPNLIYTFNQSLDNFNDKKARKLCEYGLIKDYSDSLKTPPEKNYNFYPVYITESSWLDAIFLGFITYLSGLTIITFLIKLLKKI
ncbi:hypothetical protein A2767_01250 [Candidatus Roizmanbacteria bacterium RIFCSPHIGHO2_01_FULL_35_10]|uniref:Uncharacterized protein n=1 Tax=Candidatus Roizmanbacteria bacterium RIFCSPLOWO2_01_FULL_35_13 TaxID=1802055 RepID=A0A1F7I7P0_9BACT|nr:MAG: hypothetical protein A2767_01250 [Candidatus Roizmanbacteria bacterium RIFCSPHIGHO2_01_FULL_35_10]OGK39389.1 MAG: hypothetical protein A3A74_06155 [Candidatus Roizmanbacteria bacterium RIFCSPLOWO2_01_FULL_35_13]